MAETIVIDAAGKLVGRIGTQAATAALHGKTVRIVNCERAVISGRKRMVIEQWKRKSEMGVPKKGPFIHRTPDRLVRRIIRGMLPHRQPRGRAAFERILCYIGTPAEFKDATPITLDGASFEKLPNSRFITIGQVCKELGGKWYE